MAFLCYKSIPAIGHNVLSPICSVSPLCPRKAVFEVYHLDATLHYPAAKLFTHKLDTYFICSFHRFKLSANQIVFCTTQVILWTDCLSQRLLLLAAAYTEWKVKLPFSISGDEQLCSCVLLKLKEVKMRLNFQWTRSTYRECRDNPSQTTLFCKVSHF